MGDNTLTLTLALTLTLTLALPLTVTLPLAGQPVESASLLACMLPSLAPSGEG